MNRLTIIGNLTRDPELRTTPNGVNVCSFTVAVNRRNSENNEADFFRVSAWRGLADVCAKYLAKGRKVAVIGAVGIHTYTNQKGETKADMQVNADDVEFLSARSEQKEIDEQSKMEIVKPDDLPY